MAFQFQTKNGKQVIVDEDYYKGFVDAASQEGRLNAFCAEAFNATPDATIRRKLYYDLALHFHPDKAGDEARVIFQAISTAYEGKEGPSAPLVCEQADLRTESMNRQAQLILIRKEGRTLARQCYDALSERAKRQGISPDFPETFDPKRILTILSPNDNVPISACFLGSKRAENKQTYGVVTLEHPSMGAVILLAPLGPLVDNSGRLSIGTNADDPRMKIFKQVDQLMKLDYIKLRLPESVDAQSARTHQILHAALVNKGKNVDSYHPYASTAFEEETRGLDSVDISINLYELLTLRVLAQFMELQSDPLETQAMITMAMTTVKRVNPEDTIGHDHIMDKAVGYWVQRTYYDQARETFVFRMVRYDHHQTEESISDKEGYFLVDAETRSFLDGNRAAFERLKSNIQPISVVAPGPTLRILSREELLRDSRALVPSSNVPPAATAASFETPFGARRYGPGSGKKAATQGEARGVSPQ